jgi:hypothetical protein
MLRRMVRWTLWAVKGVLALVAVAALVAWPWSYAQPARFQGRRWAPALKANRLDWLHVSVGWSGGRLGMEWYWRAYTGVTQDDIGPDYGAPRWTWELHPGSPWQGRGEGRTTWGPFGWEFERFDWQTGLVETNRLAFLPCWVLALAAGTWPLASAALYVRRGRRARRLARSNRCRRCGYDLRSTPDASSPPLATCPECGEAAAAAKSLSG